MQKEPSALYALTILSIISCGKRFTTYETVESLPLIVVKKDRTRESFDRNKLLKSVIRACDKRQVTLDQMDTLVSEIESALQNSLQNEVNSTVIGEMVMDELKKLDEVWPCKVEKVN